MQHFNGSTLWQSSVILWFCKQFSCCLELFRG